MDDSPNTFYIDKNRRVTKVTEAIVESENEVTFLCCGEVVHRNIIPIEEACAKCTQSYPTKLGGKDKCREFQKKEGERRGFKGLICPGQFIER